MELNIRLICADFLLPEVVMISLTDGVCQSKQDRVE